MRKPLTLTQIAVVIAGATIISSAPLSAQERYGGVNLPSRATAQHERQRASDSRTSPGKRKAKGKHKHADRDRYVTIEGRVCRVKESKNGDKADYKCRRQDSQSDGRYDRDRARDRDGVRRGDGQPIDDQVYRDTCGVLGQVLCRVDGTRAPRVEPSGGTIYSRDRLDR